MKYLKFIYKIMIFLILAVGFFGKSLYIDIFFKDKKEKEGELKYLFVLNLNTLSNVRRFCV